MKLGLFFARFLPWSLLLKITYQIQYRKEKRTVSYTRLKETGFCSGVENYSRHLALRGPGETPTCLIDFFPKDFLLVVDESHVTLPQVSGMYNGDRTVSYTHI